MAPVNYRCAPSSSPVSNLSGISATSEHFLDHRVSPVSQEQTLEDVRNCTRSHIHYISQDLRYDQCAFDEFSQAQINDIRLIMGQVGCDYHKALEALRVCRDPVDAIIYISEVSDLCRRYRCGCSDTWNASMYDANDWRPIADAKTTAPEKQRLEFDI